MSERRIAPKTDTRTGSSGRAQVPAPRGLRTPGRCPTIRRRCLRRTNRCWRPRRRRRRSAGKLEQAIPHAVPLGAHRYSRPVNASSLSNRCVASIRREVPDRERNDDRVGHRAVREIADAAQERTARDAGRRDEDVVAGDEIVRRQHSGPDRGRRRRCSRRSSLFRGHSFPWIPPPTHLSAAAEMTPSGSAADPVEHVHPGPALRRGDRRAATSPSRISKTLGPPREARRSAPRAVHARARRR